MDAFDKFIFDELVTQYARKGLSFDDYEELFQRFKRMEYLEEVQPYLYAMRFFGWGVPAEQDHVLTELMRYAGSGNTEFEGLYYDLRCSMSNVSIDDTSNLERMVKQGYTGAYTKDRTAVVKPAERSQEPESRVSALFSMTQAVIEKGKTSAGATDKVPPSASDPASTGEPVEESLFVDHISFVCGKFSGLSFTCGDTDFLFAVIHIKPIQVEKYITVRSQIFVDDKPWSKIFSDQLTLRPGDTWFRTTGWGNKNFNGYSDGVYKWVVEIDGQRTYSQGFRMFGGKLSDVVPKVKSVKLFSSTAKGATEEDRERFRSAFAQEELEYVYFRQYIVEPGSDMWVQVFIKVICLEDNTVFRDYYYLQKLQSNTCSIWDGVGFDQCGKWKKGLYQYSVRIGDGPANEGTFTVY